MDVSPSVYEHAAALIGKTPWEASRDGDLVFEGHAAAYRTYRHTPIMPGIDIYNLEAEAYGGVIEPPHRTGIPAIERPLFESTEGLLSLAPLDPNRDGRIPMLLEAAQRLKQTFPEANVRVPVSGPFSIASNLVGFNQLLLETAIDPAIVARALMHLVDGQVAFAEGVKAAGVDVAFFESAACPPMLSPDMFRDIELPALTACMQRIGQVVGHPIPCIIGGDTTPILDAMLETGTGYVVAPFETNQEAFIEKVRTRPDVRLRVNCDLRIIAAGTKDEIRAEADRVIELIGDHPNACMGTGALPYETPPENVLYIMEYVKGLG
jgi:uroporphyrinogen decarboxylase